MTFSLVPLLGARRALERVLPRLSGIHEAVHHVLKLLKAKLKGRPGQIFMLLAGINMVRLWLGARLTRSPRRILAKVCLAAFDTPLTWLLPIALNLEEGLDRSAQACVDQYKGRRRSKRGGNVIVEKRERERITKYEITMVYGLSWCDIEGRIPEAGCASESCAESLRPAVRERRLSQNERADRPSSGITFRNV